MIAAETHDAHDAPPPSKRSETGLAVRNALMLGSSLVATWSVALLVRLVLPRYLGPERFGALNFVDNFAMTCFTFLGFGLDQYIQRELPTRPRHGTDFFAGVAVVRVALAVLVIGIIGVVLHVEGRPPEILDAAFVFGVGYLLTMTNANFASLLHASRTVGRLSVLNVASKIVWGLAVVGALALGGGLVEIALAFLASEVLRCVVLARLVRQKLGLKLVVDMAKTRRVLTDSLPFYVNAVAITIYAKVDISIMAFVTTDTEVGWYSGAANFAGLAMLIAPLIGWVLAPQLAHAAGRSEDELLGTARRVIEGVLQLAIPVSLIMGVGADVWVRYALGRPFTPAIPALRILAPMFIITYLCMLSSICLQLLHRAWTVTTVSCVGLLANGVLNVFLVGRGQALFGPGGAGTVAAFISTGVELVVAVVLLWALGRRAVDRRSLVAMAKAFGAGLVVVGVDALLAPLGPARLFLDSAIYIMLVLASGAVRVAEVVELARAVRRRRADGNASAPNI